MEIIGRVRDVADLDIILAAHLQITLEPGRGMFRPLPLVAVRQQQHEPRHAQPLRLARGDELVDDDLGAVGEIAELRLPQYQRLRIGERIAVIEAQHRGFRQRTVEDLDGRLADLDIVQRDIGLLGVLVDQHRMAMREGAATDILAGEAHADALAPPACRRRAPRRSPSRKPLPVSNIAAFSASWRTILRFGLNPSGTVVSARPTSFNRSIGCAVSPLRSLSGALWKPAQAPSSQSALFGR